MTNFKTEQIKGSCGEAYNCWFEWDDHKGIVIETNNVYNQKVQWAARSWSDVATGQGVVNIFEMISQL